MSALDLVTGATGFIGGHLVRRLLGTGRSVRALCRPGSESKIDLSTRDRIEVVYGDLLDRSSLEPAVAGTSRVYHCAGEVSDWGLDTRFERVNIEGTKALLEAARAAGTKRFVHLSSFVIFGIPSPREFDDASPYGGGRDAYTRTKIAGEEVVLAAGETGLEVAVLRPTVVYGTGSTWLEEPARMMKRGAFFLIGGGEGTCHPCYVENLLDALLLVAEHPKAPGHAFLIADDDPISFRDYFGAISSLVGAGQIRRSVPTPVARAAAWGFESVARLTRAKGRPLLTQTAIDFVTTPSRMRKMRIREELGYVPRFTFRAAMDDLRMERERARDV